MGSLAVVGSNPQTPAQYRLLRVQAVFAFVEND